ncbi:MAG: hypothetical protein CVU89_16540 [Firmicutes bacterium HGW-Firmicutes-14]|nr:MAG: hypothetical protein CVU89_16540 [Firmicutes bacterium HGW-Firmicutes-14]
MFPYTHICFAADVLGELNSEIILGAVFPDTVIAGFLEHKDTHRQSGAIYNYLKRIGLFPGFAEGVVTHGTMPEGLDYFCDEKYLNYKHGYAFEMAVPLVDKVVECCRLPESMGLWKAHNFIEMAADVWLYNRRGEFRSCLEQALDSRDLILAISQVLAPFYNISVSKLAMSFPVYGEFVLLGEVTPTEMAKKYGKQTARKHGIDIDVPGAAAVIEDAVEIVDRSFPEFIRGCEDKVGHLVSDLRINRNP